LDFETKILVKERAPELLETELRKKGWEPQVIALSGNTDCYQPLEKHFQLTRRCLEVLARFRNPVGLITKNHLVTRDLELLGELARHDAVTVGISITTLDRELARRLEPRASTPRSRLAAVRALADAGVPVHVMVAPLIPGLNDDEVAPILAAASDAGARSASYTLLRLPLAVEPLFSDWLERNQPTLKETVLARLRGHRDGVLYRATPGTRMRGSGPQAEALAQLFGMLKRRHGLDKPIGGRSVAAFRVPPADGQLTFAW
jgi:DNA repair photolyase